MFVVGILHISPPFQFLFAKTNFWSFSGIGTFWKILFPEDSVCLMDAALHTWEMGTW